MASIQVIAGSENFTLLWALAKTIHYPNILMFQNPAVCTTYNKVWEQYLVCSSGP